MKKSSGKNEIPPPAGSLFYGYLLPGTGLLACAFWAGASLPAGGWGLGAFLCFFTLGVTLIVEGFRRRRAGTKRP